MGLPDTSLGEPLGTPFGLSGDDADELAKEIYQGHKDGKDAKRERDLTAEKYLVHIDGEGDGQWADIFDGARVVIPPNMAGGLRLQDNLLEVMCRHAVSQLTSQPFQVLADSKADKQSRDRARVDTLFGNETIRRQSANRKVASALRFAAAYGHCPIHAVWRDDRRAEAYQPIYDVPEDGGGYGPDGVRPEMRRGFVDLYVGDPWDTVYNEGATVDSVHWYSYGRVLPITQVKETFSHAPGIEELKGATDLPSASRFQRIQAKWDYQYGVGIHGTAGVAGGFGGDELVAIICRETAPGVLEEWPDGRLEIIGVSGIADTDTDSVAQSSGTPMLLHRGPLPGGRFSATRFYMGFRGDDVLGRPYVADIDDDQVVYNQLHTLEVEWLKRFARPQWMVSPGGLVDDTATTEDDGIVEYMGDRPPQLAYPPAGRSPYADKMDRIFQGMARKAGWQAASRGEADSGDSGAKVVALAKADDTIFGPITQGVKDSLSEMLTTCQQLAKEYMVVPQAVTTVTGEDFSYLARPYITQDELSDDPPHYEVVSGFGATMEAKANQLLNLRKAGLLTDDEFWRMYPDSTMRPPEIGSQHLKRKRALERAEAIHVVAQGLRETMKDMAPRLVPQAVQKVQERYPVHWTDDPMMSVEALVQVVQDSQSDPIAVQIAEAFLGQYRQMMQQAAGPPAQPGPPGPGRRGPSGPQQRRPRPDRPSGPSQAARPPSARTRALPAQRGTA